MNLDNYSSVIINDNKKKTFYDPQFNTTIVFNNKPDNYIKNS